MKKILFFALSLTLLLSAVSCDSTNSLISVSGGYIQAGEEQITPEYVLQIGSEKIGFDEYRYFFLNLADSMELEMKGAGGEVLWTEEKLAELKEQTLSYILTQKALTAYAKEKNLALTQEEKTAVKEYVDSIKSNLGDEDFADQLKTLYLTEPLYRSIQEDEKIYEKVFNKLFDEGGEFAWSEEEYQKYYNEHYICATHVLILFKKGEDPQNCPETMAAAMEVYAKTADTDFDELIREYGEDTVLDLYPTGYYFTEGGMQESFYKAAAALEIGGISEPIITTEGCHIIKRLTPDKEQVALQKEAILWGSTSTDGSYSPGVYAEQFEEFYTGLTADYAKKGTQYNPDIEAYLKPGLVF